MFAGFTVIEFHVILSPLERPTSEGILENKSRILKTAIYQEWIEACTAPVLNDDSPEKEEACLYRHFRQGIAHS